MNYWNILWSQTGPNQIYKASWKSFLVFSILFLLALLCSAQESLKYNFKNDSLFSLGRLLAVAETKGDQVTCYYKSQKIKSTYRSVFLQELRNTYPNSKFKHEIAYRLDFPEVEFPKRKIQFDNVEVGGFIIVKKEGDYNIRGEINVESVSEEYFEYIQDKLIEYVSDSLSNSQIPYQIVKCALYKDYSEERLAESKRIEAEKQRLAQFYANIEEALNGPMLEVEGVYRSIDNGDRFNYDIFVYHSVNDPNLFLAWVVSTTDPDLSVSDALFSLRKTAEASKFLLEYQSKGGDQFRNILATYSSSLLDIGVKSFIKLYPQEGVPSSESYILPKVDWIASGSGVLLNNDGYIATNHHVVADADSLGVQLSLDDSSTVNYNARVLVNDIKNDVAIIKIDDKNFRQLDLSPVKIQNYISYGETVYSIGFPIASQLGENAKLNKGIVSALADQYGDKNFFQTDLPLWYGNSGGPCFSENGELLGLATRIAFDGEQKLENVGFVSKSANITALLKELKYEQPAHTGSDRLVIKELLKYAVFIKVY